MDHAKLEMPAKRQVDEGAAAVLTGQVAVSWSSVSCHPSYGADQGRHQVLWKEVRPVDPVVRLPCASWQP